MLRIRPARLLALALVLAAALACGTGAPLTARVATEIGESLCGIAHPKGTFVSADVTGWASGGVAPGRKDRYVDLSVVYERETEPADTMLVRIYVASLEPCRIKVDVIEDTGPAPVVLDNAVVGRIVGRRLCAAFTP